MHSRILNLFGITHSRPQLSNPGGFPCHYSPCRTIVSSESETGRVMCYTVLAGGAIWLYYPLLSHDFHLFSSFFGGEIELIYAGSGLHYVEVEVKYGALWTVVGLSEELSASTRRLGTTHKGFGFHVNTGSLVYNAKVVRTIQRSGLHPYQKFWFFLLWALLNAALRFGRDLASFKIQCEPWVQN